MALTKVRGGRGVEALQASVDAELRGLEAALPERRRIAGVALAAGVPKNVPHKLGRKLQGWSLSRVRAQARVWDEQDTCTAPELYLVLVADVDVVVDLVVF